MKKVLIVLAVTAAVATGVVIVSRALSNGDAVIADEDDELERRMVAECELPVRNAA